MAANNNFEPDQPWHRKWTYEKLHPVYVNKVGTWEVIVLLLLQFLLLWFPLYLPDISLHFRVIELFVRTRSATGSEAFGATIPKSRMTYIIFIYIPSL